jgi:hypothetical protein
MLVVQKIYFGNSYDMEHSKNSYNFILLFPNYFTIPSFQNFYKYVQQDYFVWLIFSGFIFYKLWIDGKKKAVLFTILFSFGYLLLVNVSSIQGGEKFYFDNQYSLIGLFLSVCIFSSGKYLFIQQPRYLYVLLMLTFVRIGMVYKTHESYTNRIAWHQEMILHCRQNHISKICLPLNDSLNKKLLMTWGVGYESILLSSFNNQPCVTYYFVNPDSIEGLKLRNTKNDFITSLEKIPQNKLPKRYFTLPINNYVFPVIKQ